MIQNMPCRVSHLYLQKFHRSASAYLSVRVDARTDPDLWVPRVTIYIGINILSLVSKGFSCHYVRRICNNNDHCA